MLCRLGPRGMGISFELLVDKFSPFQAVDFEFSHGLDIWIEKSRMISTTSEYALLT